MICQFMSRELLSSGNVLFNLYSYSSAIAIPRWVYDGCIVVIIVQKVTPPSCQMRNGRCRTLSMLVAFFQLHDLNTRPRWLQTASTNVPAVRLFTFHSPTVISHFCAKHPQQHKDNSSTIESNIRVLRLNANGNKGLV